MKAFRDFQYDHAVGPGVYDVHSPQIPNPDAMAKRLEAAARYVDPELLWVNPDCGLKTRGWKETVPALKNMVDAAKTLRSKDLAPSRL